MKGYPNHALHTLRQNPDSDDGYWFIEKGGMGVKGFGRQGR
jgi:hypothetical protein